jgi:uncharacterized membrane protein
MTRFLSLATVAALVTAAPALATAQPFQTLVFAPGGESDARGVSGDGSVVVGCSLPPCGAGSQAVRWTSDGSSVGLGLLPGTLISFGIDGRARIPAR